MKRKLLILAVIAIGIATLAAGTLAYFTAEGEAHNVITTGGVKIALQEWADAEKTQPFEDMEGVMPNTTVTKIAEIKNTGMAPAYVRVMVTKSIALAEQGEVDPALIALDLNETDWTLGADGYLYYNSVLQPGEVTAPIFTSVMFSKAMGNEYQSATVHVDVAAEAVQSANNGADVFEAQGWPEVS